MWHLPRPCHLSRFREVYGSWSWSLCNIIFSAFTSCLLGPNVFLSTLLQNTLCICYSPNVRAGGGGGGGGYKTTGPEADHLDVVQSCRMNGPVPPLRHVHESRAQAKFIFIMLMKETRIAYVLFCNSSNSKIFVWWLILGFQLVKLLLA